MNIWMLRRCAITPDLPGKTLENLAVDKELAAREHNAVFSSLSFII